MMIGGEAGDVQHLDPIFATLAPGRGDIPRTPGREKAGGTSELGYLHCGPSGAEHFVKMVHNGIEYGVVAAYVKIAVERLTAALEPDHVVLGGGNAKEMKALPPRTKLGDNENAFAGGFALWDKPARHG